ncbi:uncharacterized protein LOC106472840 isoform X2 [Limulus polyphemus]|uniref:Uncharacterized protein LOC106472840 isoform X2 n=1 Tax=Limulus polyphemus TaxID=6850 RepID=A0ABM1TMI1_LIMPO|nr:uncharacterized protein LOC106472840 isoform X2 [Limulus polyphemus]
MKVLFATLVVFISLTLTKGNIIDIAMQMICKMNVEKPEKINELRDCMDSIFKEKSDLLPDAIRECDFAKFPYQKYEDYANEMCKEERYDDRTGCPEMHR